MINVNLKGRDGGEIAKVTEEGSLNVVVHPHPPRLELIAPLPFSQFFTDSGDSTGSKDMIVNGATTPTEFCISAIEDQDIYIKSITVQISDPGARLDRFGALSALTNGIQFYYDNIKTGRLIISEEIKTNLDFFRDATGGKDFGDGTGAWKADIAGGGGEDTYFPEINMTVRFGLVWGLRLQAGTTDKLVFKVRDNLAGLSVFNIKGYGIRF